MTTPVGRRPVRPPVPPTVRPRPPADGANGRRGAGPGTVSPTSAQRFATRVRARRRRRVLLGALALTLVAAAVWTVLWSPWAAVRRIEVIGTVRIPVSQVRAQAEPEIGHPLLLARTDDVAARVGAQRLVRSVQVTRGWPGVLRVRVREREPDAAVPVPGGVALVDTDGVRIDVVPGAAGRPGKASGSRPGTSSGTGPATASGTDPGNSGTAGGTVAGVPRVEVDLERAGVGSLRGCLVVRAALPAAVTRRLVALGADGPDGIWLDVRDPGRPRGRQVVRVSWGDATQSPDKARVLVALLRRHASAYDVRSWRTPAFRP